jgi:hypothetical protein
LRAVEISSAILTSSSTTKTRVALAPLLDPATIRACRGNLGIA